MYTVVAGLARFVSFYVIYSREMGLPWDLDGLRNGACSSNRRGSRRDSCRLVGSGSDSCSLVRSDGLCWAKLLTEVGKKLEFRFGKFVGWGLVVRGDGKSAGDERGQKSKVGEELHYGEYGGMIRD